MRYAALSFKSFILICFSSSYLLANISYAQTKNAPQIDKIAPAQNGADLVPALKNVQSVLNGMGLKVGPVGNAFVDFESKGDPYVTNLSDDGKLLFVSTWWNIANSKAGLIPYAKLMQWNNNHISYFGVDEQKDGSYDINLYVYFDSSQINAQNLRYYIDVLEGAIQGNKGILNDSQEWK